MGFVENVVCAIPRCDTHPSQTIRLAPLARLSQGIQDLQSSVVFLSNMVNSIPPDIELAFARRLCWVRQPPHGTTDASALSLHLLHLKGSFVVSCGHHPLPHLACRIPRRPPHSVQWQRVSANGYHWFLGQCVVVKHSSLTVCCRLLRHLRRHATCVSRCQLAASEFDQSHPLQLPSACSRRTQILCNDLPHRSKEN